MSLADTPPILYESKLRTLATPCDFPRRRFPLPQNSPIQFAAYAFEQDFEMLLLSFPPTAKNRPSNATSVGNPIFFGLTDGNAILTKLSQPSPTKGGKGKFTASFAIVPASWDDFKTQTVSFPGWINTGPSGQARKAYSDSVNARLHYDYFVVDPAGILTGAGVLDSGGGAISVVTSMGSIAVKPKDLWLNTLSGTPQPQSTVNDLVLSGGVTVGVDTYVVTYPSTTQWKVWITNAATDLASNAWSETKPTIWDGLPSGSNIASAGQFKFAPSSMRVYEGNIIERCTYYAIPQ